MPMDENVYKEKVIAKAKEAVAKWDKEVVEAMEKAAKDHPGVDEELYILLDAYQSACVSLINKFNSVRGNQGLEAEVFTTMPMGTKGPAN